MLLSQLKNRSALGLYSQAVYLRRMSRPFPYLRAIVVTLSVSLLLSGCLRFPTPDLGVQALRNQTEKHSLHQAKIAFLQADYSAAVLLLNRFLRNHSQSPRSLEARWWLARAYQEAGKLSSAVEHFRFLAHAPNPYQTKAQLRMTQLVDRLGESMTDGSREGILVSLDSVQTSSDLDSVILTNQEIKGSVILLNVPCGVDGNALGNGHPFSLDTVRSVIQHMHAQGIAVYFGVTLRCLGRFAQDQRETLGNWKDWEYDPQSGRLRPSPYYSLNFWRYRVFLVEWISQLRDLPLAGLVLRNEVIEGLYEGFSPLAVETFAQEFDVDFNPARIFNEYRPVSTIDADSGVQLPAVFWKWVGWKARERIRILQDLVQTLHVRLPRLQFGIEVQLQSITDPIQGLVYFAEDWVDIARGPFDMFLVMIEGSGPTSFHGTSQDSSRGFSKDWEVPVLHMVQHLGKPEKIWTLLPSQATQAGRQSWVLPEGVVRIHDHRMLP